MQEKQHTLNAKLCLNRLSQWSKYSGLQEGLGRHCLWENSSFLSHSIQDKLGLDDQLMERNLEAPQSSKCKE
jgi:hypothetical protein